MKNSSGITSKKSTFRRVQFIQNYKAIEKGKKQMKQLIVFG